MIKIKTSVYVQLKFNNVLNQAFWPFRFSIEGLKVFINSSVTVELILVSASLIYSKNQVENYSFTVYNCESKRLTYI